MYKLIDLLEIGDYTAATTTQTDVNPETGKITWDVKYKPDFNVIFKKLDDIIHNIQDAEDDEHLSDPVINQSIKALKAAKKAMQDRVLEKYPEFLK